MAWKSIDAFSGTIESLKGKKVRFKESFSAPNLSHQFGMSKSHGAQLTIPAGSIGIVYAARGATLFIGFGSDLKTAPQEYSSATFYKATIQLYSHSLHKLELEG